MQKKRFFSLIFILLLLPFLWSCNKKTPSTVDPKEEKSAEEHYPVKILDSLNRNVNIISEPKRVISLAPNISEIICAIGKENLLVGRTANCNYPEMITKIDSIGDFFDPDIDKIVSLNADLIIISSLTTDKTLAKLEENNQPYILLNEFKSIAGTYEMIEKVGVALNAEKASDRVVLSMKEKLAYIDSRVKKANRPRVYFVADFDYTGGRDTFIGDMINSAGARNAADDIEGWKYDLQQLKKNDPDILIAPKRLFPQIESKEVYKDLTAVKTKKLYDIDEDIISRQGPRLVDGIETIARIIHPELFKD